MEDIRQKIVREVTYKMVDLVDDNTLRKLSAALTMVLDSYEVQERCTELSVNIDDDSDWTLIQEFIKTKAVDGRATTTTKQYERQLKDFATSIGCGIKNAKEWDVRLYLTKFMDKSSSYQIFARNCLSSFYVWAFNHKKVDTNPMLNIPQVKDKTDKERHFSRVEMSAIRDEVKYDVRHRAMIELMASSGVRVSELCNLKINDIDFRTLTVHVHEGKGGKSRNVPMSEVSASWIQKYRKTIPENTEYLFVNERGGGQMKGDNVDDYCRGLSERLGFRVHPHRFRHTFATSCAEAGMPIQQIQILMGHSNANTTMRYITNDEKNAHAAYHQKVVI